MPLGSEFPEGCKTAKVILIFKRAKNSEPKNCRPLLPLPVMSKVIESVVRNQLIEHLEKMKLFLITNLVLEANIL